MPRAAKQISPPGRGWRTPLAIIAFGCIIALVGNGVRTMMRPNPRRCPDGPEPARRNGGVIRIALPIDARDRGIIPWRAVADIAISGSDARDMPPEAARRRSAGHRNMLRCSRTMAAPEPPGTRASSRDNRA